jgi:lipopolysaccharide export system protein LptA
MLINSRILGLLLGTWCGVIALLAPQPPVLGQTPETDNTLTVHSDIQEANSETGVFTARGNVKIYYPAQNVQATAAQAQYFTRERRLVLSGNVYVLQDGNSMRAETMTYLIDQGHFIAMPKSDQQVESIYIVSEPQSTETTFPLNNNANVEDN